MRLDTVFYRLPLRFDVDRMIEEVLAFQEHDWLTHPTGFVGNSSLILVSANGEMNDDFAVSAPMKMTPLLARCQYLKQILASFNIPISRTRLTRLTGHADVPKHTDWKYHWFRRTRIHIPIITNPEVLFYCNDYFVHMSAGEAWIFDNFKPHWVVNPVNATRIHLVIDTVGSPEFWELVKLSERPFDFSGNTPTEYCYVDYNPQVNAEIPLEPYDSYKLLTPDEVDVLLNDLISGIQASDLCHEKLTKIDNTAALFGKEWRNNYAIHGHERSGWLAYKQLISQLQECISAQGFLKFSSDTRALVSFNVLISVFQITNRVADRSDIY